MLAQPFITADPDQKRWIDRLLTDIPGANVHDVAVKPASGPAYVLTRAERGATDCHAEPDPEGPHAGEPHVAQRTGRSAGRVPLRRRARRAAAAAAAATGHARPIAPSTARSSSSPGIAKATRLSSTIATRRDPELAAKFPEPAPAPAASPHAATPRSGRAGASPRSCRTRPRRRSARAPRAWSTRSRRTSTRRSSEAGRTAGEARSLLRRRPQRRSRRALTRSRDQDQRGAA